MRITGAYINNRGDYKVSLITDDIEYDSMFFPPDMSIKDALFHAYGAWKPAWPSLEEPRRPEKPRAAKAQGWD